MGSRRLTTPFIFFVPAYVQTDISNPEHYQRWGTAFSTFWGSWAFLIGSCVLSPLSSRCQGAEDARVDLSILSARRSTRLQVHPDARDAQQVDVREVCCRSRAGDLSCSPRRLQCERVYAVLVACNASVYMDPSSEDFLSLEVVEEPEGKLSRGER